MIAVLLGFSFLNLVKGIFLFLFVICSLLLILLVLLQEPKGGGLASAFGGAGAETFGVQSGGVNRFMMILATLFMLLAILYAAIKPDGDDKPPSETTSSAPVESGLPAK
ncbi:MAG: preprotein translocase subunit SecG [Planctomycetaceae bacterium]